jgi:hypothetical protein
MKTPTGTETSNKWMLRTGWVLSGLSGGFMMVDGLMKLLPPDPTFLDELHRLGELESTLVPLGILEFTCGALYMIPRTAILGAILLTGFLGGAEALQTRVNGSGAFLIVLPLFLGALAWGGIWLRDERLRNLIPLRTSLNRGPDVTTAAR